MYAQFNMTSRKFSYWVFKNHTNQICHEAVWDNDQQGFRFSVIDFFLIGIVAENKLVFLEVSVWCSYLNFHFTFVVDKCDNFNLVAEPIIGTEL